MNVFDTGSPKEGAEFLWSWSHEKLSLPLHGLQIEDVSSFLASVVLVQRLVVSVAQLRLVAVLPYLSEDHRGVEPEEDAQGQGHSLDDRPRVEAEEVQLHGTVFNFLHLKGVDDPHGQVADEEEGDHLAARFLRVLVGGGNPPALSVRDEQQLEQDLDDGAGTRPKDEDVLHVRVNAQTPGYDVEDGVTKDPAGRD